MFEKQICDSHVGKILFEEKVAVTKILKIAPIFSDTPRSFVFVKLTWSSYEQLHYSLSNDK